MRFSDPFFSELLAGVVDKASQHSFDLLIASHATEQDETKSYLKYIRGRKVDGFLIIRTHLHDHVAQTYGALCGVWTGGEQPYLHQPAHEIGIRLCQMLLDVIGGVSVASPQVILQPTLVVRQSSGPPTSRG